MMLTVSSEKRANIADICSHNWVNDGYGDKSCLNEAEYLASLTPVRLDLLLSLAPGGSKEEMLVEQEPEEDEQVQVMQTSSEWFKCFCYQSHAFPSGWCKGCNRQDLKGC